MYSIKRGYLIIIILFLFPLSYDIRSASRFVKMPHRDTGHAFRHQCTSFCLDNNSYAVFGTNNDYGKNIYEGLIFVNKRNISKSYWGSDPVSEHVRWTSKYGSVTFNLVMSQFSWAGMNEAGLV